MTVRKRIATISLFLLVSAAAVVTANRVIAPDNKQGDKFGTDRWEQVASVSDDIDYVIVSNGYALTSALVPYGDGSEFSLAGIPVTTENGVLGGEVTSEMLWRFAENADTSPGEYYFADGDMYITHGGVPLARDTWRGDEYLRLAASEPFDPGRAPEYYSWQLVRRGDIYYLAAVSGSEGTENILYYSKYSGAFVYINNPAGMTQRLFSVKLFRFISTEELKQSVDSVSLKLVPPTAGQPALNAYIENGGDKYRVAETDWSGEPSAFANETVYTVIITVSPCGGFELADDAEVSVNGKSVIAKPENGALKVTLTFPATGEAPVPETVEYADPATLFITSDIHKYTENLLQYLKLLRKAGVYPRTVSFAGDMYTGGGGYFYTGWREYKQKVSEIITGVFPACEPVYTMGNHDWESLYDENFYDGTGDSCFASIYGFARVGAIYPNNETDAPYVIFNIGATDVTYGEYYSMFRGEDLAKLGQFLDRLDGSGKLIVINSHWPLHYAYNSGDREVKNAEIMIDLLNAYAERNDILFVWGHNHSGDPSMLTIRTAGDNIICDKAETIGRTIKFTYANAGAMIKGTGLLVNFDDAKLRLTYYALPADGSDMLIESGSRVIDRVG